jgi:hypothetical protein
MYSSIGVIVRGKSHVDGDALYCSNVLVVRGRKDEVIRPGETRLFRFRGDLQLHVPRPNILVASDPTRFIIRLDLVRLVIKYCGACMRRLNMLIRPFLVPHGNFVECA